jgi:hypothetical protein
LELTYQLDDYDLTWGSLPKELFRSVGFYLNLERDIVPLLCVCKKMTLKVLQELCYVTGYYPNRHFWRAWYPPVRLTRRVFTSSSSFYLHPLSISCTSYLWDMFKDRCFINRCFIIKLQTELTYLNPPLDLWNLSNLDTLVIKMSKRVTEMEQLRINDYYSSQPSKRPFDQYQLPSSKKIVLFNMKITPKILGHLNSNLEFIQLVNCQLELPCDVNLEKFKSLKVFTIHLKSVLRDASYESRLDLTKCTMMFPGISERLKFKDDRVLKVL